MITHSAESLRFSMPTGFTDTTAYVFMSDDKACSVVLRREARAADEPFDAACERQVRALLAQLTGFRLLARLAVTEPSPGERLDLRTRYGDREVIQRVDLLNVTARALVVVCATWTDEAARERWRPAVEGLLRSVSCGEVAP